MSKVYKCDACGLIMDDPHRARMKEFKIVHDCGIIGFIAVKQKTKIELCDECFHNLYMIAEKKANKKENEK